MSFAPPGITTISLYTDPNYPPSPPVEASYEIAFEDDENPPPSPIDISFGE